MVWIFVLTVSLRCFVAETFLLRKERYPERDTPENLSIPEVETRCPLTLDASTLQKLLYR